MGKEMIEEFTASTPRAHRAAENIPLDNLRTVHPGLKYNDLPKKMG